MGNDERAGAQQIKQQTYDDGWENVMHTRLGSRDGDQLHNDLGTPAARMDNKARPDNASGEKVTETERRIKCEVYSRVVGYLRPVSAYNIGKQQEYADRKVYAQPTAPAMDARIKSVLPAADATLPAFWLPEDWAG